MNLLAIYVIFLNTKKRLNFFITCNGRTLLSLGFSLLLPPHQVIICLLGGRRHYSPHNRQDRISDPGIYYKMKVWLRPTPSHTLSYTSTLCAPLRACHPSLHSTFICRPFASYLHICSSIKAHQVAAKEPGLKPLAEPLPPLRPVQETQPVTWLAIRGTLYDRRKIVGDKQ